MKVNRVNTLNLLRDLGRMVRQSDNWRGWVGWDDDAPSDDEVTAMLEFAQDAVLAYEPPDQGGR